MLLTNITEKNFLDKLVIAWLVKKCFSFQRTHSTPSVAK